MFLQEARDVVSPMLAGTTSLKRCPYFSQGSERRRRGGERLIWRQPVVTYSPTRIFLRKDRSRCSLCTSKCKLYFSYGSIFIMNSFSLLNASRIFSFVRYLYSWEAWCAEGIFLFRSLQHCSTRIYYERRIVLRKNISMFWSVNIL